MLGCPFCGHSDGNDDEIIEKEINYMNNEECQIDIIQPDMREKIREYINQLDEEIKRAESEIVNTDDKDYEARMMSRLNTLTEVRNDLLGRLEEVV